jgi:hypothetical protein
LVLGRWGGVHWVAETRAVRPWNDGRGMPGHGFPMHPYGEVIGRRGIGFSPLRMIAGGLICLGFLALIVLAVIALVNALRRPLQPAVTPVVAAPPAPTAVPASAQAPSRACPSCGHPVQDDWSHCPYCGNALAANPQVDSPQI